MATGSAELPPPEAEVPAVLGAFADPAPDWLPTVVAVDRLLSPVFLFDCVIVTVDIRVPAGPEKPVLKVAASLPSCVAAPSRNNWTK